MLLWRNDEIRFHEMKYDMTVDLGDANGDDDGNDNDDDGTDDDAKGTKKKKTKTESKGPNKLKNQPSILSFFKQASQGTFEYIRRNSYIFISENLLKFIELTNHKTHIYILHIFILC